MNPTENHKMTQTRKKRVLVKISGEVLKASLPVGFDADVLLSLSKTLKDLVSEGCEVCLVVGGGNFFRGRQNVTEQISRVGGDHIGMLATVMNGIALQDTLATFEVESVLVANKSYGELVEGFQFHRCNKHLREGRILIFVGGLGVPYFTTDTCATVRALEMGCDFLLKATKYDGVYDKDPAKYEDAQHLPNVSYAQALENRLEVMDQTAFVLAMENQLKILIFSMLPIENIKKVMQNDTALKYTLIS